MWLRLSCLQGVREKNVQRKRALVWCKLNVIANETYINVTNEVLAFKCRLFQLIWMLQFDATFRWMGQNNAQLLISAYWSCWLEWIHSSHNHDNSVTFLVTMFLFHLFFFKSNVGYKISSLINTYKVQYYTNWPFQLSCIKLLHDLHKNILFFYNIF